MPYLSVYCVNGSQAASWSMCWLGTQLYSTVLTCQEIWFGMSRRIWPNRFPKGWQMRIAYWPARPMWVQSFDSSICNNLLLRWLNRDWLGRQYVIFILKVVNVPLQTIYLLDHLTLLSWIINWFFQREFFIRKPLGGTFYNLFSNANRGNPNELKKRQRKRKAPVEPETVEGGDSEYDGLGET